MAKNVSWIIFNEQKSKTSNYYLLTRLRMLNYRNDVLGNSFQNLKTNHWNCYFYFGDLLTLNKNLTNLTIHNRVFCKPAAFEDGKGLIFLS